MKAKGMSMGERLKSQANVCNSRIKMTAKLKPSTLGWALIERISRREGNIIRVSSGIRIRFYSVIIGWLTQPTAVYKQLHRIDG